MSALGQRTLISLLVDPEAVDLLAREGLDPEVIPDVDLRNVVLWSLRYYHDSGRQKAPTEAVLRERFGDLFDDKEISLGDAEESIEWAVDDLKATYVHREVSSFNRAFATDMASAEVEDRLDVVSAAAADLVNLSLRLESREFSVDVREAMTDRLRAYAERADDAANGATRGMRFGLPDIDQHTLGIHDGELAILAAPPKTGKSYILDSVALREWQAGRTPVLYTLENSVEMTLDRIACLATGIDTMRWQKGECTEDEVARVTWWVEQTQQAETPLWVLQPDMGKRTIEQMVRGAQMRGCDSLLIDQLSWVEHPDPRGLARHEQVRDILRTLKTMISTGRHRMPCLVAHQINREGTKAADKDGYLSMWHLAESAEVERAADFVFGLYQSHDERAAMSAKFQTLAARRVDIRHWLLTWRINIGVMSVRQQIDLEAP